MLRPAVVDHIIPFEWMPGTDAATNQSNLWAICCDCDGTIIRPIEERHRSTRDIQALRLDKLSASIVGLDGYRIIPKDRPIDSLEWQK